MSLQAQSQLKVGQTTYLVVVSPYNLSTGETENFYFSDMPFMDRFNEFGLFYYIPFDPRVISPLNISYSMFSAGNIGGLVRPSVGSLKLSNTDGALDFLADYSFDRCAIRIQFRKEIGLVAQPRIGDYSTIFLGITVSAAFRESEVEILVADFRETIDKPFPPNSYAGTGGNEGTANLAGQPKPVTLGKVFNVSPVLVDPTSYVYQVHDGAITSIDAVYQSGELLTVTTDYTVDLSNGRFTLTSAPTGKITADVTNDLGGSVQGDPNGTGYMVEELLSNYAGLTRGTEYGGAMDLEDQNPYELGLYESTRTTVISVIQKVIQSSGHALLGSTQMFLRRVSFPTPSSYINSDPITDDAIIDIEIVESLPPPSEIIVNYKKNYSPLSETDLGPSPADRDYAVRDYLSVSGTAQAADADAYPSTKRLEIDTLITNKSDAETELARLTDEFYSDARKVYRIRMKTDPLYLELGVFVEVYSERFGLSSGKAMLVLSRFEDLDANQVTLEVAG